MTRVCKLYVVSYSGVVTLGGGGANWQANCCKTEKIYIQTHQCAALKNLLFVRYKNLSS